MTQMSDWLHFETTSDLMSTIIAVNVVKIIQRRARVVTKVADVISKDTNVVSKASNFVCS